jgi:hypothetical protein
MTPRKRRNLAAERNALRSAADRLLSGTPLRSQTGKLTATELLIEASLRRDAVYGDHKDLVEEFQARVRAQQCTPTAMQELADRCAKLKADLVEIQAELARERRTTSSLRRIVVELDLELAQAREELGGARHVAQLPRSRRRRK